MNGFLENIPRNIWKKLNESANSLELTDKCDVTSPSGWVGKMRVSWGFNTWNAHKEGNAFYPLFILASSSVTRLEWVSRRLHLWAMRSEAASPSWTKQVVDEEIHTGFQELMITLNMNALTPFKGSHPH
jgi:hypothetical protein